MVSGGVCMAYMWLWFMAWTENQINLDDLHKVLSYHHISHYSKEKVSEGNGVNNGFAASSEGGWKTKIGGDLLTLTNATEILGSITIIPNTFDPLKKKNWHKWIFWLTYTSYFFSKISHFVDEQDEIYSRQEFTGTDCFQSERGILDHRRGLGRMWIWPPGYIKGKKNGMCLGQLLLVNKYKVMVLLLERMIDSRKTRGERRFVVNDEERSRGVRTTGSG